MKDKKARTNRYDKNNRNARAAAISESRAKKSPKGRRGCGCGGRKR